MKAFDLTFSAPKSVSLLWALGSEPVADTVMTAHREAVATALGFLEEHAAVARMQVDGIRRHVATARLGGGRVRASHVEGGRPPAAHPLPGAERRATRAGRAVCGVGGPAVVRVGPGGRVDLSGRAATGAVAAAGGGVGAGPVQHPRAGRVHDGPVAGVLETDRGDRGRAGSSGRPLRVAGVADAGRRRGVAGHPAGQGPHAHPEPAGRPLAGRGRSRRPGDGPGAGSAGVLAGPGAGRPHVRGDRALFGRRRHRRVRAFTEVRRTRRDRAHRRPVGRAAHRRGDPRHHRAVPPLGCRGAADAVRGRRRGGSRPGGPPPPTAPWRTRRSTCSTACRPGPARPSRRTIGPLRRVGRRPAARRGRLVR